MTKLEKIIAGIYLCLEMGLFFLIKWAEEKQPFFIYGKIEYFAILLNFLFLAFFYLRRKEEGKILLGLTVTLLADYFLTLRGSHFALGVLCFFAVQLIYGWKIGYNRWNVFLRVALFAGFLLLIHFLGMSWFFAIPCSLSICALLGNVICSFQLAHNNKDGILNWIFAVGLLLFAGCDISLGLGLVTQGVEGLTHFHQLANWMVWIFYVPSQVLIAFTGVLENVGYKFHNFTLG
ncbi:MAG: hypothetical protein Q4E53_14195 [Eubacteriales bacterium]|nr:hypothetical protein [Eubacteriales bacterium]